MQSLQKLNRQLAVHRKRLLRDVGLTADEASKVATLVASDIRFLSPEAKAEIKAASPVQISARIDELLVFQAWMDLAHSLPKHPTIIRTQVLVQNYVCFIYLKDACFEVISKQAAPKSVAARCAKHLSRGAVRDFRNAFSHANWQYNSTFTGLECWVLEDARIDRGGSNISWYRRMILLSGRCFHVLWRMLRICNSPDNKSLDLSGGSVFLKIIGPAMLD